MTTQRETCDAFWDAFCDFVYYPNKSITMKDSNRCVDIDQGGFRCSRPAVCCPMPGCSVPHTLTDTCLKHMDERNGQKMCQECCYEFDNPGVRP